jgi:hypothetical protein
VIQILEVPVGAFRSRKVMATISQLALTVLLLPLALHAQDPAAGEEEIPDSLRFVPASEEGPDEPVPVIDSDQAYPSGDEFDMAFAEIDLEDVEIEEDYSLAIHYLPYVNFDRVDGWILGIDLGFRPGSGWYPRFDIRYAYATGRSRILYNLGIRQPVISERRLLLGLDYRRFSDHFDSRLVASGENFVSAWGFRWDYRDYFERTGSSFFAESSPLPWLFANLTYVAHDYVSLTEIGSGTWTIVRNGEPWRANPAVDESRLQSVALRVELDRRDDRDRPRKGGWLGVDMEWSGEGLGSDFTFSRYAVEGRGYLPLGEGMNLKGRLGLGTTKGGTLPFQKEFSVGGISTLPAVPYKHHRGDHYIVANLEYAVQAWRGRQRAGIRTNVQVLGVLDIGEAWSGESYDLGAQQMMLDAGIGLSAADERLRLYVLQDLRNKKIDPLWTIRLSSPF